MSKKPTKVTILFEVNSHDRDLLRMLAKYHEVSQVALFREWIWAASRELTAPLAAALKEQKDLERLAEREKENVSRREKVAQILEEVELV